LKQLATILDSFHLHKKLLRSIERRQKMARGDEPVDWSAAEALAFASLAIEGHPVRLSGQDSARGTFGQRHAVLHDIVDGHQYEIFAHLSDDQAPVHMINSPLCEAATMGYEYGYSLDCPEGLVLWEAQYGDFVNAAQVIIDQFIASAEDKWRRLSGIVLLLPHAFEGKGP
jgi:2-oxoglutarate dehydrogenase E1 component